MAAADFPEKTLLTSTLMYVDRVRSGYLLKYNILYWGLDYKRLKYDRAMKCHAPLLNCHLVAIKRHKSVVVLITTKERKTIIQGFVVHQLAKDLCSKKLSESVTAVEGDDKKYRIAFPFKLVHDKRNEILRERGRLVLAFMFNAKRLRNIEVGHYLEERDENNFMEAYERRLYTDFVIRARGKEFHVHKAILAARSIYFDTEMHKLNGAITLKATSSAVQIIIHYLYSGELPLLTLDELFETYKLGFKLIIPSFVDQCRVYFLDIMTRDNAKRIRNMAVMTRCWYLVRAANSVLECSASYLKF